VTPISPVVTLTLAGANGGKIKLTDLPVPVEIRIPISSDGLCSNETSKYTGHGTCLYWDKVAMKYSAEGCTTEQSESRKYVICRCKHLTSFVVENLVISKVIPVLRVCPVGFFGNDCAFPCFGTVINKGCRCAEGQFGFDCSQKPKKDTINSVAPVAVAAGVATDVKSASGVGVSLPAGALAIGVTIEVVIYDIDVKISSEQPGATISPAGALGVFLPHGQKFLVPVTITLKYDPSKVPDGDGVFIYYFDEDLNPPIWTQMPGKVWVFAFDIVCTRYCSTHVLSQMLKIMKCSCIDTYKSLVLIVTHVYRLWESG